MGLFWTQLSFSLLFVALARFFEALARWQLNPSNPYPCVLLALPPIVREGLIGLGHAVNVFLLLNGCAFAIGGIEQLIG